MTTLTRYVLLTPAETFSYFDTEAEARAAAGEGDRVLVSHRLEHMEAWGEVTERKRFPIPEHLWLQINEANLPKQ